jgi:beta-glucosidase/6-phospho-beta-glucosidase/beta-galactosidase
MTATATGSPTAVRRRFPEGFYLTVMLEGRYTDAYLATAGDQTPRFTDEELATIASPPDFVGINVYRPGWYVEPSDQPPGYREIPINASHPKMASAWHVLDPEVMYWAPRQMQSIWGARSIFITENGCAPGLQGRPQSPAFTIPPRVGRRRRPIDGRFIPRKE